MNMSTHSRGAGLTERLWTVPDGTVCILSTCEHPPMYSSTLVRGTEVVRECRVHGLASAQMLAQGWSESRDGEQG